jgi:hypothetical protein
LRLYYKNIAFKVILHVFKDSVHQTLFLSLILSSREIIVSVLYTPSISSIIKITSLVRFVSLALIYKRY